MLDVETRAFNTFKLTVQRLLFDFENSKNFSQMRTESKYQSLRRLISIVNEGEELQITDGRKGK